MRWGGGEAAYGRPEPAQHSVAKAPFMQEDELILRMAVWRAYCY